MPHARADHVTRLVYPFPQYRAFFKPTGSVEFLANTRYLLTYGTIEPRNNRPLTLQWWREMIARLGKSARRLIVVGKCGWESEKIVDFPERSESLKFRALEIDGLATPRLNHQIDHSCTRPMPSFGQGYKWPLVEAQAGERAADRESTDSTGGKEAIMAYAARPRATPTARLEKDSTDAPRRPEAAWAACVKINDDFLESL